jgi:hypothetical protein
MRPDERNSPIGGASGNRWLAIDAYSSAEDRLRQAENPSGCAFEEVGVSKTPYSSRR